MKIKKQGAFFTEVASSDDKKWLYKINISWRETKRKCYYEKMGVYLKIKEHEDTKTLNKPTFLYKNQFFGHFEGRWFLMVLIYNFFPNYRIRVTFF